MLSEKNVPDKQSTSDKQSAGGKSVLQRIGKSFSDSIGDIVFGMEDGTVSIFGLVFGVASSTTSSSVVLLAGATGAIAAAVSMMAGTFLDVESTNDQAKAKLAHEQMEIETNLEEEKQEVRDRLQTPVLMTRRSLLSSMRSLVTPRHFSSSRHL